MAVALALVCVALIATIALFAVTVDRMLCAAAERDREYRNHVSRLVQQMAAAATQNSADVRDVMRSTNRALLASTATDLARAEATDVYAEARAAADLDGGKPPGPPEEGLG